MYHGYPIPNNISLNSSNNVVLNFNYITFLFVYYLLHNCLHIFSLLSQFLFFILYVIPFSSSFSFINSSITSLFLLLIHSLSFHPQNHPFLHFHSFHVLFHTVTHILFTFTHSLTTNQNTGLLPYHLPSPFFPPFSLPNTNNYFPPTSPSLSLHFLPHYLHPNQKRENKLTVLIFRSEEYMRQDFWLFLPTRYFHTEFMPGEG